MNQMMYCYKNLITGQVYVDDKNSVKEIRNANGYDNYEIIDTQMCHSKKMIRQYKAKCKLKMEIPTDKILIENGDLFTGTREEFANCFFSNANNFEIKKWCIKYNWSLTINNKIILS